MNAVAMDKVLTAEELRWVLVTWCVQGFRADGSAGTSKIFGGYIALFGSKTDHVENVYKDLRRKGVIFCCKGNRRSVGDIRYVETQLSGPDNLATLVHRVADRLFQRGYLKITKPKFGAYTVSITDTLSTNPVGPRRQRRDTGKLLRDASDSTLDTPIGCIKAMILELGILKSQATSEDRERIKTEAAKLVMAIDAVLKLYEEPAKVNGVVSK